MDELDNEIDFENEAQEEEYQIPKGAIITDQSDPEIESLLKKYTKGKLILQPNFQRRFVWDTKKSSRLIESALLNIPLPIIYLSQERDEKEYVVDGQQRLTAFFSFILGKYLNAERPFRLNGLKVYPELNGKLFKDLDESSQDKILNYHIRTITFKKESASALKFDIFERLNTGAVSLNDHELRNCIYRGPYNELLIKLSEYKDFREILGLKGPHKRMKDVELVLRFAAFYHSTYLNYKSPMREFLNNEMDKRKKITEKDAIQLEEDFKKAISLIKSFAGKDSFKRFYIGNSRNPNGKWEPKQKFNLALYDILMFSFSREEKISIYSHLDAIREVLIYLMTNAEEFIDSIAKDTNNTSKVRHRFDVWLMELRKIVASGPRQPRCFSRKLKEDLFNNDPTCAICSQRIIDVDDAEMDHIQHYWRGGETIPENARLTHRYCNRSRLRRDIIEKPSEEDKETKGKKLEILINWSSIGKDLPVEKISETKSSDSMALLIERFYKVFGRSILERMSGYSISRGPIVSDKPALDFINKKTGKPYQNQPIANSGYYVLTHSSTEEKIEDLSGLIDFLNLRMDMVSIKTSSK